MRKDGARNAAKAAGGLTRDAHVLIGREESTQPAGRIPGGPGLRTVRLSGHMDAWVTTR